MDAVDSLVFWIIVNRLSWLVFSRNTVFPCFSHIMLFSPTRSFFERQFSMQVIKEAPVRS